MSWVYTHYPSSFAPELAILVAGLLSPVRTGGGQFSFWIRFGCQESRDHSNMERYSSPPKLPAKKVGDGLMVEDKGRSLDDGGEMAGRGGLFACNNGGA